jgi:hypothetical protein
LAPEVMKPPPPVAQFSAPAAPMPAEMTVALMLKLPPAP